MGNKHGNGARPAASRETGEEGTGLGDTTSDGQPEMNMAPMHISALRVLISPRRQ